MKNEKVKLLRPDNISKNAIQTFIKEYLTKEQVNQALNFFLNEDTIDTFRTLLDNSEEGFFGKPENKYLFDLAMFLIINENISIDELISLKENQNIEKILEEMVVFELGLYLGPNSAYSGYARSKNLFLRDNIFPLFYKNINYKITYQDKKNVFKELERLLEDSIKGLYFENTNEHKTALTVFKEAFNNSLNFSLEEEFSLECIEHLFVSINNDTPTVLKHIGLFSFILNIKNTNDITSYKEILDDYSSQSEGDQYRYYLLEPDDEDKEKFIRKTCTFENLRNFPYYETIFNSTNSTEIYKISVVLNKFLENISRRTIYYKS